MLITHHHKPSERQGIGKNMLLEGPRWFFPLAGYIGGDISRMQLVVWGFVQRM